jgi:hypothetical protein
VGEEPAVIDLSAAPDSPSTGTAAPAGRQQYLWGAAVAGLVLVAGVWVPLRSRYPPTPAAPGPTVQGVPLSRGASFHIDADPAGHRGSCRFSLTDSGTAPVRIDHMYAPVPGMALLRADPPHAVIAPKRDLTVTLTFVVSDCAAALDQQDPRPLRVVVGTDSGPIEWQVDLAAASATGPWQVDLAARACRH